MKLKTTFTAAFFVSLLSAIAFICLSFAVDRNKVEQFDHTVITWVQGLENPTLTSIMRFFTTIGSILFVLFLSAILLYYVYKRIRQRTDIYFYLAVLFGDIILNQVLKNIFKRARPDLHRLIEETGYSFPSGHSMIAFAMYGAITFLLWKHISRPMGRGMLILFSTLMIQAIGISRIYLGVHYPSDVIGSYLFSSVWLAASIWFYQRYKERHAQPNN